MKSTIIRLLLALVGIHHIGGCTTNNNSEALSPEVRNQVSSVSISPTIFINARINLPEPPGAVVRSDDDDHLVPYTINSENLAESVAGSVASGIVGAIEERRESNFNKKVLEQFDYRKFIVEKLYRELSEEIKRKDVFALTSSEEADAEFVLEVKRIELKAKYPFLADRLRKLTPSIHISLKLIKDPPIKLQRTDSGRIEPWDSDKHPILYHETIVIGSFKGLPSHLKADYQKESVFTSAYNVAIEQAVTKLLQNW